MEDCTIPRIAGESIPKYRKHRATGQAICTIAGKDRYLGPPGTKASRLEYDRLISEWLASGRSLSFGAAADEVSLSELIVGYLDHARRRYRKAGRTTSELAAVKSALRPLRELYGKTAAAEFGPLALRAVPEKMIASGYARKTINDYIDRIHRVFKWAVGEQLVTPSVLHGLQAVEGLRAGETEARETSPIEPVPEDVVDATMQFLPETVRDMIRIQRFTAMRPGELVAMRPADIDRTGDVWLYVPESHKTQHHGKGRVVFIGPRAQRVLMPYLLRPADAYCFSPADSDRKRRAEVTSKRTTAASCGNGVGTNRVRRPKREPGEAYTVDAYRRCIERACDRAFPAPERTVGEDLAKWRAEHRWTPHRLRHSAATEIRSKFGLKASQVALGHANARITEVYAERDVALGIRVALEVG